MMTKRIIPCLDIKDGRTVKGTNFVDIKDAGDPLELAYRYEQEGADELVFLDISATNNKSSLLTKLVAELGNILSIPFCVGGGIQSVKDVYTMLYHGADKVAINSAAIHKPALINELSAAFGSQAIVLAVDAKLTEKGWKVFTHGGKKATQRYLIDWVIEAEQRGAGEILFTSMDHDGTKNGYAIKALKEVQQVTGIPIIASGGAGTMEDFLTVFQQTDVEAALAASVFHYQEIPLKTLKEYLRNNNLPIRI